MWRYLLLGLVGTPFVWTAYEEWRQVSEGRARGGSTTDAAAPAAPCEGGAEFAAAGRRCYQEWARSALRIDVDPGDDLPAPPELPAAWKDLLTATGKHTRALARARVFADHYRRGEAPDGEKDEKLRQALQSRQVERKLLGRRSDKPREDDQAALDDDRTALDKAAQFRNKAAQALLRAWLDGNSALNEYGADKRLKQLEAALARAERLPEQPPFDPQSVELATTALRRLGDYSPPSPADEPTRALTPLVKGELQEWQTLKNLIEKVNHPENDAETVRGVAEVARKLKGADQLPDVRLPQRAVQALLKSSRSRLREQPPDETVEVGFAPETRFVARADVIIVLKDGKTAPLGSPDEKGVRRDEHWLETDEARASVSDVEHPKGKPLQGGRLAVRATPRGKAAHEFNKARLALLTGDRWTRKALEKFRNDCDAPEHEKLAEFRGLAEVLKAILDEPGVFLPP